MYNNQHEDDFYVGPQSDEAEVYVSEWDEAMEGWGDEDWGDEDDIVEDDIAEDRFLDSYFEGRYEVEY
jgi:hypothetical protein